MEAKEKAKFERPHPAEEDSCSEKEDEFPVIEADDRLKRELTQQHEVFILTMCFLRFVSF
jgi:hypothetical protein